MNKICCIGHITHDKIITPNTEVDMPGGTSYYFAHAMYHLMVLKTLNWLRLLPHQT